MRASLSIVMFINFFIDSLLMFINFQYFGDWNKELFKYLSVCFIVYFYRLNFNWSDLFNEKINIKKKYNVDSDAFNLLDGSINWLIINLY